MFTDAAKDGGGAEREMFGVSAQVFLDLCRQFAGGATTRARMPQLAPTAVLAASFARIGSTNAAVFSGPDLGNPDKIVSGQNLRNSSGLNRCRFGVTSFLYGFENVGIEAKGAK